MNTMYNARIEFSSTILTEQHLEKILENLEGYSASLSQRGGRLNVRLFVPGVDLAQASRTALTVAAAAVDRAYPLVGPHPVATEVMTEEEFNAREGFEDVPELLSVAQAAERLGVSRQAVLKAINAGSYRSAAKVGDSYVVGRAEVEARAVFAERHEKIQEDFLALGRRTAAANEATAAQWAPNAEEA